MHYNVATSMYHCRNDFEAIELGLSIVKEIIWCMEKNSENMDSSKDELYRLSKDFINTVGYKEITNRQLFSGNY